MLSKEDQDRLQLGDLFMTLDYLMIHGHFYTINHFLDDQHITSDNHLRLFVVGMLRFVSPIKDRLWNWETAVKRVKNELDRRGLDSSKILRGLLDDKASA